MSNISIQQTEKATQQTNAINTQQKKQLNPQIKTKPTTPKQKKLKLTHHKQPNPSSKAPQNQTTSKQSSQRSIQTIHP